jgi:hypothetical protein
VEKIKFEENQQKTVSKPPQTKIQLHLKFKTYIYSPKTFESKDKTKYPKILCIKKNLRR